MDIQYIVYSWFIKYKINYRRLYNESYRFFRRFYNVELLFVSVYTWTFRIRLILPSLILISIGLEEYYLKRLRTLIVDGRNDYFLKITKTGYKY